MNKQMRQDLETVINSIVNEDEAEVASAAFHNYLRAKTQAILMNESDDSDEDDKDEDKDDKDEDKDDKKKKKGNPFAKKDDEDKDEDEDKDDDKDD